MHIYIYIYIYTFIPYYRKLKYFEFINLLKLNDNKKSLFRSPTSSSTFNYKNWPLFSCILIIYYHCNTI